MRVRILVVSLGMLAACATPDVPQPDDLSTSFQVTERRPGKRATIYPSAGQVDYKSSVIVQPDNLELARAAKLIGREPTPEVQTLQSKIRSLEGELATLLLRIGAFEKKSHEFWASGVPVEKGLQQDSTWRFLNRLQRGVVNDLADLIASYVSQVDYGGAWKAGQPPSEEFPEDKIGEAEQRVSAIYEKIAPTGDTYDSAELTKFINRYTAELRDQIKQLELSIVKGAGKAELQMEAKLLRGDKSLPVSISPYTVVAGVGRGKKSDRIGIPSIEEVELVQREYEQLGKIADNIREIKKVGGSSEERKKLVDKAIQAIRDAASKIRTELVAPLDELKELSAEVVAGLKPDAEALAKLLSEALEEVDGIESRRGDSVSLGLQIVQAIGKLQDDALTQAFTSLATKLKDLPAELDEGVAAVVAPLKTAVDGGVSQLRDALASADAGALSNLFVNLQGLAGLARQDGFGDIKPGDITRRPFAIADAPAGVVDLSDTPAESGDELKLEFKLVSRKADGTAKPPLSGSETVGVRKFGWYTNFSSQLIFYDRKGDGSSSYEPAPGIAYNLHYRPDSDSQFWDVFAPGAGISVSSPNFESGTELAIGLHGTLFNDMLQVGYARNISVDDNPEMFYFGLDLIQVFQSQVR